MLTKTAIALAVLLVGLACGVPCAQDLPWPLNPESNEHLVSATYGVYLRGEPNQGNPMMHAGIDIEVPVGTPVYAVESGWVKTVTTRFNGYSFWRIVIGDSAGTQECEAWLYAHIKQTTIPVMPGHWVEQGQYLGDIVDWPDHPPTQIIHLHLCKIRYHGTQSEWTDGQEDWVFIDNPLEFLVQDVDPDPPVFRNALGDQLLAFCENETDDYFGEGEPIGGDVDIICNAYDIGGSGVSPVVPYKIEYRIDGESSIPWTVGTCFTGEIGRYVDMPDWIDIVYQDDATCNTWGSVFTGTMTFFYNLTNSNGDLVVEPADSLLGWQTSGIRNGTYKIVVRVSDYEGNQTLDSMNVEVNNEYTLTGTVAMADGIQSPEGVLVTVEPSGSQAYTDINGYFEMNDVSGGSQTIAAGRFGYADSDTTILIDGARVMDLTLQLSPDFICGDVNGDSEGPFVNDLTYLVEYTFDGQAPPPLQLAANVDGIIGPAGMLDISDVTYLVEYLFAYGPNPICVP